jgi:TolB-like protein/lipopolysaccharide biosynthesis regulator YciM
MNFIDELKRRKVIRVGITYAVVAFVIMQLVEIIFPIFQIPLWASQFVIILLFIGFPVTLILAWVFDRTPEGIVKTPPTAESVEGVKSDTRPFFQKKRNIFLAVGILAGIVIGWLGTGGSGGSNVSLKSIAVLPFENLSTNQEDEYFSDGITEDIITELSKINDLLVISRTSVMNYKGSNKTLTQIGDELGVGTILEGTVRRVGERVRITGQLIDARTDKHLWAEKYDRQLADIFAVQDEVASAIASALKMELSQEERERIVNSTPTENIDAYQFYLKGRSLFYSYEMERNNQAIEMFKKAINLDPDFAHAYAGLSLCYRQYSNSSWDDDPIWMVRAFESAQKSLDINPDLPESQFAMGFYYEGQGDYENMGEHMLKVLELNPKHAHAHDSMADIYHRRDGQIEKGYEEYGIALSLDPFLLPAIWGTADLMIKEGKYKSAIGVLENLFETHLSSSAAQMMLGRIYRDIGDYDKSIKNFEKYIRTAPSPSGFAEIGISYIHAGRVKDAIAMSEKLKKMEKDPNRDVAFSHLMSQIEIERSNFELASQFLDKYRDAMGQVENDLVIYASMEYDELMGELHLAQGKWKEAIQSLNNVSSVASGMLGVEPYWVKKHYMLGKAYEGIGDIINASREYEKFLDVWSKADNDLPKIVDAKKRLTQLRSAS